MNYLAHGKDVLHDPYLLAGTALPDWVQVLDRKSRLSDLPPSPWEAATKPLDALVAGVRKHHEDDLWFHRHPEFQRLVTEIRRDLRQNASPKFRAGFVAHLLVELLLDASLQEKDAELAKTYYASLRQVDLALIEQGVELLFGKPLPELPRLVNRFLDEQFLLDYRSDEGLEFRVSMVLRRLRLDPLPSDFRSKLPAIRESVDQSSSRLLNPSQAPGEH